MTAPPLRRCTRQLGEDETSVIVMTARIAELLAAIDAAGACPSC